MAKVRATPPFTSPIASRSATPTGSIRASNSSCRNPSPILMYGEGRRVAQAVEVPEERQPARRMGVGEPGQKEPPEQAGEHPHWQEEVGSAAHPMLAVERYPAARYDHVEMRMQAGLGTLRWREGAEPLRLAKFESNARALIGCR